METGPFRSTEFRSPNISSKCTYPTLRGVVVPGNDDERVAVDAIEVLARSEVLVPETEGRQVAGAHDDVRLELVDLPDRALEQARLEVRLPAVQV